MSSNGSGNRSRANADEIIVAALAAGRTLQEAAETAGVSARTVSRRFTDPAFKARIQAICGETIGRALGRMADGMTIAADVLRELLKAEAENVRLGAARALLDLGLKLREHTETEERIVALENQIAGRNEP